MELLESRVWPTDYWLNRSRQHLAARIHDCIRHKLFPENAEMGEKLSTDNIYMMLERPNKADHGLWALPCPRLRLPAPHSNPMAVAKLLASAFEPDEYFITASAAGPFLNVMHSKTHMISQVLEEVLSRKPASDIVFGENPKSSLKNETETDRSSPKSSSCLQKPYGWNEVGSGRKILLDYSAPNIAKPFHAGHLRSTIIGNFLKHIYTANGFKTVSINYLGDWGKQYGLLAVGFARYGSEEEMLRDPIKHLFDVYVRVNRDVAVEKGNLSTGDVAPEEEDVDEEVDDCIATENKLKSLEIEKKLSTDDEARLYFKRMEAGDSEALSLWRRFRELSIKKYVDIYKRLNIEFDDYSGESCYEDKMVEMVKELKEKQILEESQGAQVVDLESSGLGKAIILKRDGTSIYLTRDVAAAHERFMVQQAEKVLYVIAAPQEHHMRQLKAIMKRMGYSWSEQIVHVSFGMVLGMSTRKGNVVFLEDILDDAREVMHNVMASNPDKYAQIENPMRVADILAVSAIVVQDMSARRIKDYEFKIERITRFEGDTGPYLQYAHARLCSIERKSGIVVPMSIYLREDSEIEIENLGSESLTRKNSVANGVDKVEGKKIVIDLSLIVESEAFDLVRQIADFPEVIQEARLSMEPCALVSYLMSLSRSVSTCLDRMYVMNVADPQLALARLALYRAARVTLGNGLYLLGLIPLERM